MVKKYSMSDNYAPRKDLKWETIAIQRNGRVPISARTTRHKTKKSAMKQAKKFRDKKWPEVYVDELSNWGHTASKAPGRGYAYFHRKTAKGWAYNPNYSRRR